MSKRLDRLEAAARRVLASNPHNQKQTQFAMDDLAAALGVQVIHESRETPGPYEVRFCQGLPTDCCDFGVVSLTEGREVARVWRRDDAQRIAVLLNAMSKPAPLTADEIFELREILGEALAKDGLS